MCIRDSYKIDYDAYRNTYDRLSPDVRADLNANNQFWEQYEGQIAEVSNQINDSYLKANGQTDGVQSYDPVSYTHLFVN